MLRDLGYQVICARNGREAIQLLKAGKRFDLLFSDVVMPKGITGVELAREAKRMCDGIKFCSLLAMQQMCWRATGQRTNFRSSASLSAGRTWRNICGW